MRQPSSVLVYIPICPPLHPLVGGNEISWTGGQRNPEDRNASVAHATSSTRRGVPLFTVTSSSGALDRPHATTATRATVTTASNRTDLMHGIGGNPSSCDPTCDQGLTIPDYAPVPNSAIGWLGDRSPPISDNTFGSKGAHRCRYGRVGLRLQFGWVVQVRGTTWCVPESPLSSTVIGSPKPNWVGFTIPAVDVDARIWPPAAAAATRAALLTMSPR